MPDLAQAADAAPARGWQAVLFVVKYAVGVLFTQSMLGAVCVAGWTQRLCQRAALKKWWSWSEPRRNGGRFDGFLAAHADLREHRHWPNWFAAQNFRGEAARRAPATGLVAYARQLARAVVGKSCPGQR